MLLPKADPEQINAEDLADPRTELIRQLLEYKKYKDAANMLGESAREQKTRFHRPNTIIKHIKPNDQPQLDMDQVSVWNLLEAFDSIVQATGGHHFDISHITDDTPMDLYQIEILHRLQSEGPMTFERIFDSCPNRLVMVGLFLAILELIRNELIWAEQAEANNAIYLKALTDEPAEQAVRKAIIDSDIENMPQESQPQKSEAPTKDTENQPISQPPIPIVQLPPKEKQVPQKTKYEVIEKQ